MVAEGKWKIGTIPYIFSAEYVLTTYKNGT